MKKKQNSRLTLNKKTVTVLSNAQRLQVQGGVKNEAAVSWFKSMLDCNTITCCSVPFCSVIECGEEPEAVF